VGIVNAVVFKQFECVTCIPALALHHSDKKVTAPSTVRRCPYAYGMEALSALSFPPLVNTHNHNLASYLVSRLQAFTFCRLGQNVQTWQRNNVLFRCHFSIYKCATWRNNTYLLREELNFLPDLPKLPRAVLQNLLDLVTQKIQKGRWPILRLDRQGSRGFTFTSSFG